MRKLALLLTALLLGLVTGCGAESVSPTPTSTSIPTLPPSPTSTTSETVPAGPTVDITSSGSASCAEQPFTFQVESRIPPVTEEDHVRGPANASMTVIEYADFQ